MTGLTGAVALLAAALAQGADVRVCTRISDGAITYPEGHYLAGAKVLTGFDPYGYNFEERLFIGSYANAYLGADGMPPYQGDDEAYLAVTPAAENTWYWAFRKLELRMSWDEAWLSNRDCDGDRRLDRHPGFKSYLASGAELTNFISGGEGEARWTHFSRIVAVPAGAIARDGRWYWPDGTPIGPAIWGGFAIASRKESGLTGAFVRPAAAGIGTW
ncbi:MAG: hypothetical protein ACOX6T_27150 [Myxococcales bacterium]|jgi:hypothetical protein